MPQHPVGQHLARPSRALGVRQPVLLPVEHAGNPRDIFATVQVLIDKGIRLSVSGLPLSLAARLALRESPQLTNARPNGRSVFLCSFEQPVTLGATPTTEPPRLLDHTDQLIVEQRPEHGIIIAVLEGGAAVLRSLPSARIRSAT
jgi:hypothetical protein